MTSSPVRIALQNCSVKNISVTKTSRLKDSSGRRHEVEVISNVYLVNNRKVIQCNIRDNTEHKRTKDLIKRLARFPSENPNPVLRVSTSGVLEYANAAAGLLVHAIGARIGGTINTEWQAHIDKAIAAAIPIDMEYNAAERTFDITFTPVADCHYVNLYARDITNQKKAEVERKKLQVQLTQAHKMEAVGRLAGGVAHDFNNMLGVISGYTEMALDQLDPAMPLYTNLLEIKKATERSAALTRQLLAFARRQTITPKILDLNDAVSSMLKMLGRLIGEDINLVWLPGAGLHSVRLDPSQVDQILANLCINARDSIINNGKIILKTANISIGADYCTGHAEMVPGDYVFIEISDNGCGMNAETLAHIFEPFFTAKEVGKGHGTGTGHRLRYCQAEQRLYLCVQ